MISSRQVAILLIIVLPLLGKVHADADVRDNNCSTVSESLNLTSTDIDCTSWKEFCEQDGLKDCKFTWEKDEYFDKKTGKEKEQSAVRLIVRLIFQLLVHFKTANINAQQHLKGHS